MSAGSTSLRLVILAFVTAAIVGGATIGSSSVSLQAASVTTSTTLAAGTGTTTTQPGAAMPAQLDEAAAADVLARAGVEIYADDTRTLVKPVDGPASPLRLLVSQVSNLDGDFAAADLDILAPMPAGTPPLSALLAGYVATADTAGADVARQLMSGQRLTAPQDLTFPTIVLALFVADLLPRGGAPPVATEPAGFARPASASDFCTELSSFLNSTLAAIAAAATAIANDVPILGPILGFAGDALGLAADVITGLAGSIPFVEAFKDGVALVGVLITAATAFQPWKVTVTPDAVLGYHYGITHGPPATGRFAAAVVPGPDPLELVRPCAEIAGISLPAAETVAGAPVVWTPLAGLAFGDHALPTGQDAALAADGTAGLDFLLSNELASVHAHGELRVGTLQVRATVHRGSVDTVAQLAEAILGEGVLGGIVGVILGPTLIAEADAALTQLLQLADANGVGASLVLYHVAQRAHFFISLSFTSGDTSSTTNFEGLSCNGLEGPWNVTIESVGHGGVLEGAFGSGHGTFSLPEGIDPGSLVADVPVTVMGQNAVHHYDLTVAVTEGDPVQLSLTGTDSTMGFTNPFAASGPVEFQGACPEAG